jgi:hypothetical protein
VGTSGNSCKTNVNNLSLNNNERVISSAILFMSASRSFSDVVMQAAINTSFTESREVFWYLFFSICSEPVERYIRKGNNPCFQVFLRSLFIDAGDIERDYIIIYTRNFAGTDFPFAGHLAQMARNHHSSENACEPAERFFADFRIR